jgi:hypothetical protein
MQLRSRNREYGRRDPSHWPRDILYPQKLALTSPTIGGRSVCIVRPRTQATEFSYATIKGALSPEVRRTGHEADLSPPNRADIKKTWIYAFTPPYVFMAQCSVN